MSTLQTATRWPLARYCAVAVPARCADGGAGTAVTLLALGARGGGHGGAFAAGLLVCALQVPHAVAGPFVGALVDRVGRPRLAYAVATLAFAAALAGTALTAGRAPLAVPAALALVAGTAGPLLAGGLSGAVVALVPGARRARAHALDAATYNVSGIAAPAAVAALATAMSPRVATLALAAAVASGTAALAALPLRRPSRHPAGATAGLRPVARALWARPELRAVTVATTLSHLGAGGFTVSAVLLAGQLGGSHALGGVLVSGYAAGALAGSLLRLPDRLAPFVAVRYALLGHGVALGLAAVAPGTGWALAATACAGFFDGPLLTATLTARGRDAPEYLRTGVFTTAASLKITASALGAAACGALSGLGGRGLLLAVAASQPLSALAGWMAYGGARREG